MTMFWCSDQLQEDEQMIAETVGRFVDARVIPLMPEAYEQGVFPKALISELADLGLLGLTLPTEYGGAGASYVAYGLACHELERGDSGLRSFVSVQNSLCMYPIFRYGSEEQKKRYLPAMARGEVIGCFGLTEPNSGSDPSSMQTTATPTSEGWILHGSKTWITNAPLADLAIVWAKTPEGIRGFLVERGVPGFESRPIHSKLSLRASSTGELFFDECRLPREALLPGSTRGLGAPLSCLTQARYGIAWGAMGAARACYDLALRYTQERHQFSKPLASFQLVQADLVAMYTELLKAEVLNFQLGRLRESGDTDPVKVSLAKKNACREALKIARSARNLVGANGISLEYHVMRHMNNLEAVFTYEGTDNVHTLIVGREITGLSAF